MLPCWERLGRRTALVSALPLLLYGLLVGAITLFLLAVGGPSEIASVARGPIWHNSAIVVAAVALAGLAAAAIAVARGRLPVWSYPWLGAAAMGMLVALNLVIEDRDSVLSPAVDITALALFALAGLITFGAAALRGWRHSGLFSLAISATLGLSLCFFGVAGPFQIQLGLLAALLAVFEAALVYVYVRRTDAARILALAGVWVADLTVAWTVEWLFRRANPAREISQFWALAILLTTLLVGGTLAGVIGPILRQVFRR